jgi:GTPase SAR1 family protein
MTPSILNTIEFCNEIADDQLTLDEIKLKILHGIYSLDEIEKCISVSNLNIEVLEVIKRYLYFNNVRLEFYDFRDLPPLLQDRTDIYVLGNQNSGKSTFLASLFSYVNRMGLLYENTHSLAGTIYKNNLQTGYDFGFFPPEGFSGVNYICCDLENPEDINKVHPLNIIEFNYQKINLDTHVNNFFDPNSEAKQFLKNDNSKILLFFIEYSQNLEKIVDNSQNLVRLLQRLKQFGILERTTNINIVITKCDLFPAHEDPMEFAVTFINQNYLSFITDCKSISTYYNRDLKIKVFPFSLGELAFNSTYIKTKNNLWPKMIVDEIFSTTFYKKRTTSFFSRFFK